ncbi:MAG: patatin-like phospholipase family protein [Actinomycetota bacterium]
MSDETLAEVGHETNRVHLEAGQRLWSVGDSGDSMCLVCVGRLELIVDGDDGESAVIDSVGPGDLVGQYAMLAQKEQAFTVQAVRDCELVLIDKEHFNKLLHEEPEFVSALLANLAEHLVPDTSHSGHLQRGSRLRDRAISLVSCDPSVNLVEISQAMLAGLRRFGTAAIIHRPGLDASDHAEALRQCEIDNDWVLMVADGGAAPKDEWTKVCLRQADRTMILAGQEAPPPWLESTREVALGICLANPTAAGLAPWLDACNPTALHHLRPGSQLAADAERCTRRLTGHSVGVVLSGGGPRGTSHIGVLAALEESGVKIDRIAGTSIGAFMASIYAMGMDPGAMQELCRTEFVEGRPFNRYSIPRQSLLAPSRFIAMLERVFGDRAFEELATDLFVNSSDLKSADVVVHRRGRLAVAVQASMSVPGLLPPVRAGAQLLVDGGVLDNMPLDVMAETAEGPLIGVDVEGQRLSADEVDDGTIPGIVDTIARSVTLSTWHDSKTVRRLATLIITPALGQSGRREFDRLDEFVESGRQTTVAALAALDPQKLKTLLP